MCFISYPVCSMCGGAREHVTSVWVHQHVNALCHPQMCWRELAVVGCWATHAIPGGVCPHLSSRGSCGGARCSRGRCLPRGGDPHPWTLPNLLPHQEKPLRVHPHQGKPLRLHPIRESPSRASPYRRPQASPAPRKTTRKTRGVPESLQEILAREQARQTRHMGVVARDLRCVTDSLASSAQINESLQDVSGNCAAIVTCVGELQATTS